VLFPAARYTSLRYTAKYAISLDDRRFLMIRPRVTSTADKLIVVKNWFEELERNRGSDRRLSARLGWLHRASVPHRPERLARL
jgi:hypothetical protein